LNIKKITKTIIFLLFFAFVFITTPLGVYADTQYVSDNLIIMMRSGAGGDYKIIKTLKTGTPLEILEESGDYFKVKTSDNTEGWVLKRYITANTPKRIIISSLRRKIDRSKEELAALRREKANLVEGVKSEKTLLKKDKRKIEKDLKDKNYLLFTKNKQLKQMTEKYKTLVKDSANVVKIVKSRDNLNKDNIRLSAENKALTLKNGRIQKKNAIFWFLAGGFVFFFGWIAGQLSRKKRSRF